MEKQEETKLDRTEFGQELSRQVTDRLGEGYQTEISRVRKNNGVMKDVMHVRKENSECIPCFYMDELYRSYLSGEYVTGMAEQLVNIVLGECETVRGNAKEYLKKEWLTDHLFIRLIHLDKNREDLTGAVYREFLDLAAVVYVLTEDDKDGVKSFRLPSYMWDSLEIGTVEEYFPKILANTERLFPSRLSCMEHMVLERVLHEEEDEIPKSEVVQSEKELFSHRLYILSNRRRINGAAVLLYPEMLKKLGKRFSGDYYVIPSSVHEVLLLKKTGEEDAERLNRTVCDVNEEQVAPEEILSDHIYYYSVAEETLFSYTE